MHRRAALHPWAAVMLPRVDTHLRVATLHKADTHRRVAMLLSRQYPQAKPCFAVSVEAESPRIPASAPIAEQKPVISTGEN